MFSKESWSSTSSPTEPESGVREATPIEPDFGIVDGPDAKQVPLLKRNILGYPMLPSATDFQSRISFITGKTDFTPEELDEITAIAWARLFLRLAEILLRWVGVAYLTFSSLFWASPF